MLYMLDKRLVRYDCWVRSAEAMLLLYLMPLAALETIATKKRKTEVFLCGRWRIRTADPLLVRQTLWTSWAKRPYIGRDDTTRTCDPLVPNQVYYQLYYIPLLIRNLPSGRDDTTRTCDPLVPNQVYYQLYYIPFLSLSVGLFLKSSAKVRLILKLTRNWRNYFTF